MGARALTKMRGAEIARYAGRITLLLTLEEVTSSCLHGQLHVQRQKIIAF